MINSTEKTLRITEIFHSIQGESNKTGLPSVFIRLTGCPLRCQYCDTSYAFNGGQLMDINSIIIKTLAYTCQHVCVTGGEPLAQPGCFQLLTGLCDAGLSVSLETSGARDIHAVDERVMIIMDLKTPASNENHKNKLSNIPKLKPTDQIKFVICNREDYDWACDLIMTEQLGGKVEILFSPSWGQLLPTQLAEWILKDKLNVRFQLQLHKILWNDAPGH